MPSSLAVTIRVPSGLNAAPFSAPNPGNETSCLSLAKSQIRIVPSAVAVRIRVPSALEDGTSLRRRRRKGGLEL